jgi:hypothetical protein
VVYLIQSACAICLVLGDSDQLKGRLQFWGAGP